MADITTPPVDTQAQGAGNPAQDAAKASQPADLMIPKWRFDEATKLYRESEAKLAEALKEIEGYKAKDTKIAELEKQIKDMEASYALEKSNAKKESAIEAAIKDKTVDLDVVKKLLDNDKISFNDKGEIEGLDDQIKKLQTDKPYLWKKAAPVAKQSSAPASKPEKTFAQKLAEKKAAALGVTSKSKNYFS